MTSRTDTSRITAQEYISIALVFVYLLVLVRTAWLSDDAYITFRYAYNVVNGYGLTWNPGYRVQAYTNPLWMGLISAAYFVTREIYFTSLVLSMLFSVGTLGVVWRLADSHRRFWLGALVLILSKAYVDYSTSGLENPLLHFLVAIFAYVLLTEPRPKKRLLYVSLVGALVMTTRMDAVLLVTPAVFLTAGDVLDGDQLPESSSAAVRTMAIGGLPFIAWKAFATFYYGFPVPNTYFAKTNTTKTTYELIQRGYHYLVSSFAHDIVLLLGLAGGFSYAVIRGNRQLKALTAGAGLYICYVIYIGGDFMAGRFLTAPLLISVIVLVRTVTLSTETVKVGLLALLVVSVGLPASPPLLQTLRSGANYGNATVNQYGTIDERGYYYQGTGLIANKDRKNAHRLADQGRQWANSSQEVYVVGTIGMRGYYAGPNVHIIDFNALADPLLSHIEASGRAGHYARSIPAGYIKTKRTGENHLKSKGYHRYYDNVTTVTTGRLWSTERLKTIIRMNLGAYDHLLTPPHNKTYPLARVNPRVPNGTAWMDDQTIVFDNRISVTTSDPVYSNYVEVSADKNDRYRIEFINNGTVIGSATVRPSDAVTNGLVTRRVKVPQGAARAGYTRIRIVAEKGDGMYSVGHVRPINRTAPSHESSANTDSQNAWKSSQWRQYE